MRKFPSEKQSDAIFFLLVVCDTITRYHTTMRTSISIDDAVAALADKIAIREKRNFSNLCEVALAEYCGPRESSQAHAELIATAEEVGIDAALAALKRAMRAKTSKATAAVKRAA